MKRRGLLIALPCLIVLGLAVMLLYRQPRLYQVTILPTLGGKVTNPTGINNHGQVVGYAEAADGTGHFFLWDRDHGMEDLGLATRGAGFCINDAGQIAGTTKDPNGNDLAFLWDRTAGMRTLGTLGGGESMAMGLNNHGQVVGWSRTPGGSGHAFVWDETTGMRDLGTVGGSESEAHAINDSGQIVGAFENATDQGRCPVLWTSADTTVELSLAQSYSGWLDINNQGYVPGRQSFLDEGNSMVLCRAEGDSQRLFHLGHQILGEPVINDANQILFSELHWHWLWPLSTKFSSPWTQCYLWDPTLGKVRLDRYVPSAKGETLLLHDLNDSGHIVGVLASGPRLAHHRAVLLEPIPERRGK